MNLERKKGIDKVRIVGGNKKVLYALLICIFIFLIVLIAILVLKNSANSTEDENLTLANPASVNCLTQNGTLFISTSNDGSQTGYCTSKITNQTCEEWALYRGECKF